MTTLNQFLELVRQELGDTDPVNARWTTEGLEKHLQHALEELSAALPRQLKSTLTTTAGSRDLDLATLQDRLSIEAVEYPTGNYPPTYVRFSLWGDTLTLLIDSAPTSSLNVLIYWTGLHTLHPEGSSVPPAAQQLLCLGAAGYAALEWASLATNQVNVGGEDTWRHYLTLGEERLAAFHQGLAQHARRRALQARRFYSPAQPKPSQSTDWGP